MSNISTCHNSSVVPALCAKGLLIKSQVGTFYKTSKFAAVAALIGHCICDFYELVVMLLNTFFHMDNQGFCSAKVHVALNKC